MPLLGVMPLILAVLFTQGFVAASESTPPPKGNWNLERLMKEFSRVKKSETRFFEQKTLKILTEPLELSGRLTYTAPHRLEKITEMPYQERLVLNGDELRVENQEGVKYFTLDDLPAVRALVESFRATLAGDLESLRRHYRVDFSGGKENWQLVLSPLSPKVKEMLEVIRIKGAQARITTIEIIESDADRSLMQLRPD
jgi:outer membrane lipoprotein-sorting protein